VYKTLASVAATIRADFQAAFEKDPAARSWFEVLTCYPGLHAIAVHRFAHLLYARRWFWPARFLSHIARWLTGVEIHPGATIGAGIFIDHGMGVVIGETAIIGRAALIYQGVTIGGTGKQKGKRHPTVGDNVVVGAGAKVLGNIEIGNNTRIGAGSVVLRTVPSDCTVVGVPGRVVYQDGERIDPLAHGQVPDPLADVIRTLVRRIDELESEVQQLRTDKTGRPAAPSCAIEARLLEDFLHGPGI
jgi:serine O-acetyltransferase